MIHVMERPGEVGEGSTGRTVTMQKRAENPCREVNMAPPDERPFSREDHVFRSGGIRCAGWLYRPEGPPRPPVVIMAHGFAGERRAGLAPFARRFAGAGMAVFLFDYRGFGDSEGTPRDLVDPGRHVADWEAALRYVRSLEGIDSGRVALWGTSFSGGHVMVTAARHEVRAGVAQVPYTGFHPGGDGTSNRRASFFLWALGVGLLDRARDLLGLSPYYVPVVGPPGSRAVLNTPGAEEGYRALIPPGEEWANRCAARIFLTLPWYRPGDEADRVTCPFLFVLAERDRLIPASSVEAAARRTPGGELYRVPAGHFEVYRGDPFDDVVSRESCFLEKHLTRKQGTHP